tara:strand:+ start:583 stop:5085 length:4503 start_codon:yes stop_codon:yes gene_type:complete
MATLEELLNDQLKDAPKQDDDDDIGIIRSALSGVASGVFKIPEGVFSLGASLIDLGLGTNTAAGVEKFFDKINPFDEAAEATAAGRITELIVNIGIPGGIAFKAGKNLAKTALAAKQSGNYFTLTGKGLADDVISKGIPKATKFNIAPINKKVQELALNKKGKILEFAGGAGLGGVAEGAFVGDVQEAGTLGDFLGGPTKMNREEGGTNRQKAKRELGNRLKFGIEGAGFTGVFGTAGAGISRLRRGPSDTGRVITDPMEKYWNKMFSKLSKRGSKGQTTFEGMEALRGSTGAEQKLALDSSELIEKQLSRLYPKMESFIATENSLEQLSKKKEVLNKTLLSGLENKKIKGKQVSWLEEYGSVKENPDSGTFYNKQLTKVGRDSGFTLDEILEGADATKIFRNEADEIVDLTKVGIEDGFTVKFPNITDEGFEPFKTELLKNTKGYIKDAPLKEIQESVRLEMDLVRNRIGDLFSSLGRMTDKNAMSEFKTAMKSKVSDFLDSGAKRLENNVVKDLDKYPPSRPIVEELTAEMKRASESLGVDISEQEIESIIQGIYQSARLEVGFNPKYASSGVYFKDSIPTLLWAEKNSLESVIKSDGRQANLFGKRMGKNLSDIKNVQLPDGSMFNRRDLLNKLIGKSKDGLNTIITGTTKLSNIVRKNEVQNELIENSMRQKKLVRDWTEKVNRLENKGTASSISREAAEAAAGIKPKSPEIVNTPAEAREFFGGTEGTLGSSTTKSTGDWAELTFDAPDLTPIYGIKRISPSTKELDSGARALTNNLAKRYALIPNAEALVGAELSTSNKGIGWMLYKNAILYPKAGAQLAKTVLGPVTHARNFLSAMAFAGANGVLLNNELGALKKAWNTTMGPALVPGQTLSPNGKAFYNKLLNLGVVNSNVSQGDLNRLLKDVRFGETVGNLENRSLNNIVNIMSRGKRFAQDAYTAEDDFWKIFTWLGEKTRLEKSLREITNHKGLAIGEDIIQVLDDGITTKNLGKFNEEWLEKRAADLVKNNVPNYAYVSDFVKGIRKWPVGNFVSFPAEMIRTSSNIVETALKEIKFQIKLPSGEIVKPFASIGKQRLRGLALTAVAVPTAAVTTAQMLYDVSKDEINALRRYVPKWSKNGTLIPIRNEDGSLSYIDFSHMNAYDLLLKPIQGVINSVEAGKLDNNGIMDDFIMGLAGATADIGSPFITSSLWTEALQDVMPSLLLGRGGVDVNGRRIWNSNDSIGNIAWAQIKHLSEAVAPLNWQQLRRLGLSTKSKDSEDRFDKYGREYTLGKELAGMVGMRAIDVDPAQGIKYKINNYQKNIRNSRSLFTGTTLRGGPETPEDIVDAYINANRALYASNRELYKDILAARELGLSESSISNTMRERGAGTAYRYLSEGIFKPYTLSKNVKKLFAFNAEKLGLPNPLEQAADVMDSIVDRLSQTSIIGEEFPLIENPFKDMPAATLGEVANVAPLPANVTSATPSLTGVNVNGSPFESLNLSQKITKDNTLDTFIP